VDLSGSGIIVLIGIGLLAWNEIGLVNIWVVRGKVYWVFRLAVVTGSIAVPVLIAGWDLVFVFLVQSVVFLALAIPPIATASLGALLRR
jgi:hypothetical protein